MEQLVVNRAVVSQIEDLLVYCCHGLVWSADTGSFTTDPAGCPLRINFGSRDEHEDLCEYAFVSCPNSEKNCAKIRKKDLPQHLELCSHMTCPNKTSGCTYLGNKDQIRTHQDVCVFQGQQDTPTTDNSILQIMELRRHNQKLTEEVRDLSDRVNCLEIQNSTLEQQNTSLTSQLVTFNKTVKEIQEKYDELSRSVDRLTYRKSPSRTPKARSVSSPVARSPSISSLPGSPKHETWVMPFTFKCIGTLRGHAEAVLCLAHSEHSVFSGGAGHVIKQWDTATLASGCKKTLKGHTGQITCLASGNGHLYSAAEDLTIRTWQVDMGEEEGVIKDAHEKTVCAMVLCNDYLFTSSQSIIKIWSGSPLKLTHSITGLHHWVRALAVNCSKDKVYSGSHNTIEIWDSTGKFNLCGKINYPLGSVHSLAVTSQYIIAGTYNKNIEIFDVTTQEHTKHLSGHIGIVTTMMTSLSGRFLFTGSSDSTIQIWNLENMLPIQSLSRHEAGVNALTLHDDYLFSGSDDTEIKVFKHFKMQMGFA